MVWVLVAVILGAIVYAVSVIGEYRVFLEDMEPRIEALIEKAERFEENALEESEKRDRAKERVRTVKEMNAELQREIRLTEAKLRKAHEEFEQLELKAYKMDFQAKK